MSTQSLYRFLAEQQTRRKIEFNKCRYLAGTCMRCRAPQHDPCILPEGHAGPHRRWNFERELVQGLNSREAFCYGTISYLGWEVIRFGWPDFLVTKNSKFIALEVKSVGEEQLSPAQIRVRQIFQEYFRVPYHVVLTPRDCQKILGDS